MKIFPRLHAALIRASFTFFFIAAAAHAGELPVTVIDAFNRADIPPQAVGMYVQEVGGSSPLVAINEALPFSPASTMKLLTSDAALEMLGPTFTWKTQAYATGTLRGTTLHGDLIIKGGGDPKLVIENLWLFLRKIRAQGIGDIKGNLVIDHSLFADIPYDPAAFDGDPLKPYNVGPDALLLNFKALSMHFTPNAATGKVAVAFDPPLAAFPVVAPRLERSGECGDWHASLQPAIDMNGARFAGGYPLSCGEKSWYVHPYQLSHAQYFELVFRRLWAELGGYLHGTVRVDGVPPGATLVAEWESPPLSEVIRDINKYSNNVMARQLLLTLGAQAAMLPAAPVQGAAAVHTWLNNKGIAAPELIIENGAGLSRNERISAATMARMLDAAFRAPTMPEFISSLPLAGYDGTMRHRLNGQGVAGKAHIKTGTLNDVRAVAGYVMAASGKYYVVVCLVNHPNASRAQEAQDALLQWVYERG